MKTLLALDQHITNFAGEAIKGHDGKIVTVRSVLTSHLGAATIDVLGSPANIVKAYKLGKRIHAADKFLDIEDSELLFLQDVVGKVAIYSSIVTGFVLGYLGLEE